MAFLLKMALDRIAMDFTLEGLKVGLYPNMAEN
jgi:hypothetical protein